MTEEKEEYIQLLKTENEKMQNLIEKHESIAESYDVLFLEQAARIEHLRNSLSKAKEELQEMKSNKKALCKELKELKSDKKALEKELQEAKSYLDIRRSERSFALKELESKTLRLQEKHTIEKLRKENIALKKLLHSERNSSKYKEELLLLKSERKKKEYSAVMPLHVRIDRVAHRKKTLKMETPVNDEHARYQKIEPPQFSHELTQQAEQWHSTQRDRVNRLLGIDQSEARNAKNFSSKYKEILRQINN